MKKGDIEFDTLIPWIIAAIILAVMIIGYIVLKSKGINALEFIENLFRFRR